MWRCLNCDEECEDYYNICFNCRTPKGRSSEKSSATQQATSATPSLPKPTSVTPSPPEPTFLDKLKSRSIPSGVPLIIGGVMFMLVSSNRKIIPVEERGDVVMAVGILCLSAGGALLAVGLKHLLTPTDPINQPVVTQSVSPKTVELGNTPHEVQSVMGQPDKIMNLGAREIHIYKDMKIIYVDGKVSDVQLS